MSFNPRRRALRHASGGRCCDLLWANSVAHIAEQTPKPRKNSKYVIVGSDKAQHTHAYRKDEDRIKRWKHAVIEFRDDVSHYCVYKGSSHEGTYCAEKRESQTINESNFAFD